MKGGFLSLFWLTFVLSTWWQSSNAEDKVCKEAQSKMIKFQMKMVTDCTAALKSKTKKPKSSCVMRCVLEKGGILDGDGYVDMEGSKQFLRRFLAAHVLEKADFELLECAEHVGELNPKEESCATYDPLIKCGTKVITGICG